jgi:septal ring factor EnvC (AmiA/AmiB activator)
VARRLFLIAVAPLALLAASAPALQPVSQAEADYRVAKQRADALEQAASGLKDKLEKLRARQRAAVEGIEAAEARITLASLREAEAQSRAAEARRRLVEARRPASMLLAGLATMARQPPLLALADAGDVDTLVRTRILFDATMPQIRRRSAGLEHDVSAATSAAQSARAARTELAAGQSQLEERMRRLAELEHDVAAATLKAGDRAYAATDTVEVLGGSLGDDRASAAMARDLARMESLPRGPRAPAPQSGPPGYRLPASAAVTEGFGAVDRSGVRSRGLTLATSRGMPVTAPAGGTVRFSGAVSGLDGVILIDHGDGWMSLLTNVTSPLAPGARVSVGQAIGRALGPIGIELSRGGNRYSPALIAGSSGPPSNDGKSG